jgi:hypothetical protein
MVGVCVNSLLDHVSHFLLVHILVSYSTTRHHVVRPHFIFFDLTTWLDDFLPRLGCLVAHVCPGYFMCHALVHPFVIFYLITWPIQVLPRAKQ